MAYVSAIAIPCFSRNEEMTASDIEYQISETEKIIKIKEKEGKDASVEKSFVKSWKKWLKREQRRECTEKH